MSRNFLRLKFTDYDDGTGKLRARAEANGFAGRGEAYFNIADIEGFAHALATFPLVEQKWPAIVRGFLKIGSDDEDVEELGISVYIHDAHSGYIGVQAQMVPALQAWDQRRYPNSARVLVITTYQPLADFGKQLLRLVHGKAEEAILLEEV